LLKTNPSKKLSEAVIYLQILYAPKILRAFLNGILVALFSFANIVGYVSSQEINPSRDTSSGVVSIQEPVVKYSRRVALGFVRNGRISELMFEESDYVDRDQILARIDSQESEVLLELASAKANAKEPIDLATVDVSAAESLLAASKAANQRKPNSIANQEIRRLELDFERAKATLNLKLHEQALALVELKKAKVDLESHSLRAPWAGFISVRKVNEGASGEAASPILELVDPLSLRLEGYLPAEVAWKIPKGVKIVIRPTSSDIPPCEAKVGFVDITSQQVRKLVRVWAKLPDDCRLKEGMTIEAEVLVDQ
jgi:multidrug efflux pump subunit AcrA (membrane-fusion protein)